MDRLIIPLTEKQCRRILEFFLNNPFILHTEHYLHTHSPLDNLEHYIWEELYEPYHVTVRQNYEQNGFLSDFDIDTWIDQERYEET